MNKLLIICGPTATGKTKLAVNIAREFNGEIVSADSRQVYRGMDIGTGKDLGNKCRIKNLELRIKQKSDNYLLFPYILDGVPVWMLDVVDPDEEFSVSQYQILAKSVIENIFSRKKLPIITGGTGLYINSLFNNYDTFDIKPNQKIRNELSDKTLAELQEIVKNKFPEIWHKMNYSDRMNPRRLVRKIEIGANPVNPIVKRSEHDACWIGLAANYSYLYQLIDTRVEKRFNNGIIEEIKKLLDRGYTWDLPSMSSSGYQQWQEYFEKGQPAKLIDLCLSRWKFAEHAYARRQMTWFRKNKAINWFDVSVRGWEKSALQQAKSWYNHS